jgi:putative hydrolase of the HAD superfamily
MTRCSKVRIIFFDAAGTLFHLPRGVGWHYREVARRHGRELDVDGLDAAFRAAWKRMPAPPATGAPRPDDDKGWWRELVGMVLDQCGADSGFDRGAYFEEVYAEFTKPGIWELYPEVPEVLERLRRNCRLAVISNFDGRLRPILDTLGIAPFFEHVTVSSEAGADKPDARIFQSALRACGAAPTEALHAGDDPVCDWEGAAAAGLHVFRLDRPRNSLRALLE